MEKKKQVAAWQMKPAHRTSTAPRFNAAHDQSLAWLEAYALPWILRPGWMLTQWRKLREVYYPAMKSSGLPRKRSAHILRDLIRCIAREKCLPFHYFHYGLWMRGVDDVEMDAYLPETRFYYHYLPRANRHRQLLDDKITAAALLESLGSIQPRTLMYCRNGAWYDSSGQQLDQDAQNRRLEIARETGAIIKPALLSSGGEGIKALTFTAKGWEIGNTTFDPIGIAKDGGAWLVQQRLYNGGSLTDLRGHAVNTLRVVTIYNRGEIQVLYITLKFSLDDALVDNGHAGGVYIAVDLVTGHMGTDAQDELGQHYGTSQIWAANLPKTITEINHVCGLVCRAARLLPTIDVIGWDVAITDDGPMIIEGNSSPGLALIQKPHKGAPRLKTYLKKQYD